MATTRTTKAVKDDAAEDAVDEVWMKLQTENHIPPLVIKVPGHETLTLPEPTKTQIDAWRTAKDVAEGERALFGDQVELVHEIFDNQPVHIWENFNVMYLKHMFGTTGDDDLKRLREIVDRYWAAICWDCQHLLNFSAYEYFQWEHVGPKADGSPWWQRKRPMEELMQFFDTLMNISGTMTNEAVLLDPQTIEWMGSRKDTDDGPHKVRIFGHTELVSLVKNLIELQTGKQMPRPVIPGLALRLQRKIIKTHNAVADAQERARKNAERIQRRREKSAKKD
ncbi:tail assembly chaperone [Mycobacterium phage Aziz]|uniref:Tail assembly chaperone n=2 Tax=Reyvirus TaxID=1623301 RepID=A0A1L6BYF9_9CAUD|nr:tail assembly chaperone [Mycobacterium phage Aziz]YP_010013934.1 tail assembly chaperone [Mycobacterium phage MrMagoo]ARM70209.1 tail assembly chaperone [Mycobacterium phage GardenSalsa]ASR75876.1 tail assembly chaperone [Mycobacterium phage GenevaB15]APQ42134.1 tail assembly chaperone [Mycobacterium phage MrMagoo]QNJ56689.1 tail assembly chaperone [Mycobacterium phage Aziz]